MNLDLSIVVPVGPGDEAWRGLMPQLEALDGAQVIVAPFVGAASAASFSPSEELAAEATPTSQTGRAAQQNRGARKATRTWLWFLHADSRLAPATRAALANACASTDAIYWFDLRYRDDGPALCALNALGARLRSRVLGLPFGDQGLLMPRAVFERLGGFDETVPLGEDLDLVRRARAAGVALRPAGAPLFTSARRYAEHGWLATTLRNLRLTVSLTRAADRRIRDARA